MSKVLCLLVFLISFQISAKTYVIPSETRDCNEILEVFSNGPLARYEKVLRVGFVGESAKKTFILKDINRYYDSVWLDYYADDGEKLEYYWDDGYGIDEGFRFRGCIYEIF